MRPLSTLTPHVQFGEAEVICYIGTKNRKQRYECKCRCGTTFIAYKEHLLSGRTTCCPQCAKGYDLREKRMNGWVAIHKEGRAKNGEALWLCRCETCGTEIKVSSSAFRKGRIKCCKHACLQEDIQSESDFCKYTF